MVLKLPGVADTLATVNKPGPYYEQHAVDANSPTISMSQVLAAGLASVGAAVVTSRFGVAGTILGAALTTMIITGGSAILKSYLENFSNRVKKSPEKLRAGRFRRQAGRSDSAESPEVEPTRQTSGGMTVYGRRSSGGGVGKLGSAFAWFRNLSSSAKRRILVGAAIPAILAFGVGMGTITGFEFVSGQPLSCTFGGNCQTAYSATGESSPRTSFGSIAGDSSGNTDNAVEQQVPGTQSQESDSGILDNIPGVSGNGNSGTQNGGGQTPVYEQPSGGEVPVEEVPVEEAPVEEVPVEEVPVTPASPTDSGVEAVPTE